MVPANWELFPHVKKPKKENYKLLALSMRKVNNYGKESKVPRK